jgi:hypothetical protein
MLVMPNHYNTGTLHPIHYHVSVVSGKHGIGIEVVEDYSTSRQKYDKTIQLLKDLEGLKVSTTNDRETIFEDGSTVRWRPCVRGCMVKDI